MGYSANHRIFIIQVLFNYSWLHAKISAGPIANVLDDFIRALAFVKKPEYKRQVAKMALTFSIRLAYTYSTFSHHIMQDKVALHNRLSYLYCQFIVGVSRIPFLGVL